MPLSSCYRKFQNISTGALAAFVARDLLRNLCHIIEKSAELLVKAGDVCLAVAFAKANLNWLWRGSRYCGKAFIWDWLSSCLMLEAHYKSMIGRFLCIVLQLLSCACRSQNMDQWETATCSIVFPTCLSSRKAALLVLTHPFLHPLAPLLSDFHDANETWQTGCNALPVASSQTALTLTHPTPFHSWNHNANEHHITWRHQALIKALQPGSTSTNFSSRKLSLASCAQLFSTHVESALKESWPQSESSLVLQGIGARITSAVRKRKLNATQTCSSILENSPVFWPCP